ncbi:MAG TPA: CBS domain-containing protein [Gaiellaceae bacterium]|jgi:CBS domain-containing protein
MKVHELMTTEVITVHRGTALKDAARILTESGISGLPVVDAAGRPIGVISEGDIVHLETGEGSNEQRAVDARVERQVSATSVGDSMSSPAVTIAPDRQVTEAARTMIDQAINRLPVVDETGQLVGVLTRADLVRAFVRSDDEIADEIHSDVLHRRLWLEPDRVHVKVRQGRVVLTGLIDTQTDAELIPIFTRRVPGVISVTSRLSWLDQNGRLEGRTESGENERSGAASTVAVTTLLTSERHSILEAATAALSRARALHYASTSEETVRQRLNALFDQLLVGLTERDLGPIVAYAERMADERFSAGYDLSEVQVAFNTLEEATWSCLLSALDESGFAEAIGLISTVLGAGKDALARKYVSLATERRVRSLDVRSLFGGNAEGVPRNTDGWAAGPTGVKPLTKEGPQCRS